MSTVTGRTAIIGVDSFDAVHVVTIDGEDHPARTLVRHDASEVLQAAALAPVLRCLECGRDASAVELYLDTPLAGQCSSCAWDLVTAAYPTVPVGSVDDADDAEDAA
jgi:hypothetical protein